MPRRGSLGRSWRAIKTSISTMLSSEYIAFSDDRDGPFRSNVIGFISLFRRNVIAVSVERDRFLGIPGIPKTTDHDVEIRKLGMNNFHLVPYSKSIVCRSCVWTSAPAAVNRHGFPCLICGRPARQADKLADRSEPEADSSMEAMRWVVETVAAGTAGRLVHACHGFLLACWLGAAAAGFHASACYRARGRLMRSESARRRPGPRRSSSGRTDPGARCRQACASRALGRGNRGTQDQETRRARMLVDAAQSATCCPGAGDGVFGAGPAALRRAAGDASNCGGAGRLANGHISLPPKRRRGVYWQPTPPCRCIPREISIPQSGASMTNTYLDELRVRADRLCLASPCFLRRESRPGAVAWNMGRVHSARYRTRVPRLMFGVIRAPWRRGSRSRWRSWSSPP